MFKGNDNLHLLTDGQDQMLRIDVVDNDNNNKYWATYKFVISDASFCIKTSNLLINSWLC